MWESEEWVCCWLKAGVYGLTMGLLRIAGTWYLGFEDSRINNHERRCREERNGTHQLPISTAPVIGSSWATSTSTPLKSTEGETSVFFPSTQSTNRPCTAGLGMNDGAEERLTNERAARLSPVLATDGLLGRCFVSQGQASRISLLGYPGRGRPRHNYYGALQPVRLISRMESGLHRR